MSLIRSTYFLIAGFCLAIVLPFSLFTISASHNWWTTYISWVAFFMQSFLMLTAAVLTYRAAFHKKILGGEIGAALRVFAIGLILIGCGLTQIPFMDAYDLWRSEYVNSGAYFMLYILGGLFVLVSLLLGKHVEWKREVSILGVVGVGGLGIRFILGRIPLLPHTFYSTVSSYQTGLTIDTVILCIVASLIFLSILQRNIYRNSNIGRIFHLQSIGFLFYLIPIISDFLEETVPGWNSWYTYTLGGTVVFAGSLLLAAFFFYKMALYIDQLHIS